MNVPRRTVIKLWLGATATGVVAGVWWKFFRSGRMRLRDSERDVLSRIVDLLVPADEGSPGAVDLGVDNAVFAAAGQSRSLRGRIRHGLSRLNELSQSKFGRSPEDLDHSQLTRLIEQIAEAPRGSVELSFFRRLHKLTVSLYYSHPETWMSLGYPGPPQPLGFMDHADPPPLITRDAT